MRDEKFDIIKGLAIILIVLGHVLVSGPIRSFIYLFHVSVFFMVAGWFYRSAENGSALVGDVGKKVVRIWWPFVFWATLWVLGHNLLLSWGVYPSDPGANPLYARQGLLVPWCAREVLVRCVRIPFLLDGATGLGAPYWFLIVLFAASVSYALCDFAVSRLPGRRLVTLTVIALALILVGRYGQGKILQVLQDRFCLRQTLTAFALMHLGVLLRAADARLERLPRRGVAAAGLVAFVLLVGMMPFGRVELVDNDYPCVLFLFVTSLLGGCLLYALAVLFGRAFAPIAYAGRHSLAILLLHWLVVTVADILLGSAVPGVLRVFARAVLGVIVPLGLNALWWWLWRRIRP